MSQVKEGVETETIEEIWNIPNFKYYSTGNGYTGNQNTSQQNPPHAFLIGSHLDQTNEPPVNAEARLLSISDPSQFYVLSISLPNQNQNPHWTITAKFLSIHFMKKATSVLFLLVNLSTCSDSLLSTHSLYSIPTPRQHPSSRSEKVYVAASENLFSPILKPEEVNLRTSTCVFKLPRDYYSTSTYIDTDNSLTIKFSLKCKITRNANSFKKDISQVKAVDMQLCRSQALNDFEALLNDTTTADIKLKTVKGKDSFLYCHKSILAARSPVFRAMFETASKDPKENVITIKDISFETMEHFLLFLYCGSFRGELWIQFLPHLTDAAEKYRVSSLKEFCDSNLIRSVTCENALVIASLAHKHQLAHATVDIRNFIARNAGKLNLDIVAATQNLGISD